MKNCVALLLLLIIGTGLAAQGYDDSMLIYKSYKQQINNIKAYS